MKTQLRYPMETFAAAPSDSALETRKAYLSHEASVRSIGTLYYLSAGLLICGSLVALVTEKDIPAPKIFSSFLFVIVGAVQIWAGSKVRKLDPAARTPVTVLSCLGLLAIPIGTLINGYILYLILSEKGKYVFSEEYRAVVAATSDVKYRMSPLVLFFIALVILLVVLAIVGITVKK